MKSKKIFWGIILIFFGTILLLENFNIIEFYWSQIWRFWPVLLILVGINTITAKSNPKIGVPIVIIFTLLLLGLLTYKGMRTCTKNKNDTVVIFEEEDEESETTTTLDSTEATTYSEDYDTRYKTAKLIINGAAGSFAINDSTTQLLDANVKGAFKKFMLKKTETDTSAIIELNNNKSYGNTFKSNKLSDIDVALNVNPLWDIEANIGAGEINLDLSNFKIDTAILKGGAAAFSVTLGNKYNHTTLTAETGVASVEIKVPELSGCRVYVNSGLSAKEFNGFNNLGKGVYETSNFKKSTNKVYINLKGGLSSFEVTRY
ncbi:MAG: hypothetical protein EAZ51_05405 [Sphingobacteriales bacterium]|nr:MAG: hypothetical protein EAZ64_06295 [Sphingobacteriales bacterium]TAF80812.1 MAG: hypothetical protein EAZ51_05405 [Sphingobacteriales bacterium]